MSPRQVYPYFPGLPATPSALLTKFAGQVLRTLFPDPDRNPASGLYNMYNSPVSLKKPGKVIHTSDHSTSRLPPGGKHQKPPALPAYSQDWSQITHSF